MSYKGLRRLQKKRIIITINSQKITLKIIDNLKKTKLPYPNNSSYGFFGLKIAKKKELKELIHFNLCLYKIPKHTLISPQKTKQINNQKILHYTKCATVNGNSKANNPLSNK